MSLIRDDDEPSSVRAILFGISIGALLLTGLIWLTGCGPTPRPPGPSVPTYTVLVSPCGAAVGDLPGATYVIGGVTATAPADGHGEARIAMSLPAGTATNLLIKRAGQSDWTSPGLTLAGHAQNVCLGGAAGPSDISLASPLLPPAPSREVLLNAPGHFQGLWVDASACGWSATLPLFDVVLASMTPACREQVYAVHKAAGDQIISVSRAWCYQEADQAYRDIPCQDYRANNEAFRALIADVVAHGFYVRAFLAGDGWDQTSSSQSNAVRFFQAQSLNPTLPSTFRSRQATRSGRALSALSGGVRPLSTVFDPSFGGTDGPAALMQAMPGLFATLSRAPDLTPFLTVVPGFDGVIGYDERTQSFGPWNLDQLNAYLVAVRQLCPRCTSAVETAIGPLGGTLPQFLSPPARDALDQVLHEFWSGTGADGDLVWQIADRSLGPAFVRPPDMPGSDDPGCPPCNWIFGRNTSRGPLLARAFEYHLYQQVRGAPASEIQAARAYLIALGYPAVD